MVRMPHLAYTHAHAHTHARTRTCTRTLTLTLTHKLTRIGIRTRTQAHTRTCTCTHKCTRTCTRPCTRTRARSSNPGMFLLWHAANMLQCDDTVICGLICKQHICAVNKCCLKSNNIIFDLYFPDDTYYQPQFSKTFYSQATHATSLTRWGKRKLKQKSSNAITALFFWVKSQKQSPSIIKGNNRYNIQNPKIQSMGCEICERKACWTLLYFFRTQRKVSINGCFKLVAIVLPACLCSRGNF